MPAAVSSPVATDVSPSGSVVSSFEKELTRAQRELSDVFRGAVCSDPNGRYTAAWRAQKGSEDEVVVMGLAKLLPAQRHVPGMKATFNAVVGEMNEEIKAAAGLLRDCFELPVRVILAREEP